MISEIRKPFNEHCIAVDVRKISLHHLIGSECWTFCSFIIFWYALKWRLARTMPKDQCANREYASNGSEWMCIWRKNIKIGGYQSIILHRHKHLQPIHHSLFANIVHYWFVYFSLRLFFFCFCVFIFDKCLAVGNRPTVVALAATAGIIVLMDCFMTWTFKIIEQEQQQKKHLNKIEFCAHPRLTPNSVCTAHRHIQFSATIHFHCSKFIVDVLFRFRILKEI